VRHPDVNLFRLVDSYKVRHNPFPYAVTVEHDQSDLVHIWKDFRTLRDGAPPELSGAALRDEIARIAVWSYVSGNFDGPGVNPTNAGFARVLETDGRWHWRGVLIDAEYAFERDPNVGLGHRMVAPWETTEVESHAGPNSDPSRGILGMGPVMHLPEDVAEDLFRIATNPSRSNLAERAGLNPTVEADRQKMAGTRERAKEVLSHYGRRVFADDSLLHADGKIYLYRGGKMWHVPNPQTFDAMRLNWSAVQNVSSREVAAIPVVTTADSLPPTAQPHP
jgi:hypothetical protein